MVEVMEFNFGGFNPALRIVLDRDVCKVVGIAQGALCDGFELYRTDYGIEMVDREPELYRAVKVECERYGED